MALRGCTKCLTAPLIKCQKCRCLVCAEHSVSRERIGPKPPYPLCSECHVDYLTWVVETAYTIKSTKLCCLLNITRQCFFCKEQSCEQHWHLSQDCPTWSKWKKTPINKKGNCCTRAKTKVCYTCFYPSCGNHKTLKYEGRFVNQCRLCKSQLGY